MGTSGSRENTSLDSRMFFPATLSAIAIATFLLTVKLSSIPGGDISVHIRYANLYFAGLWETPTPGFYWVYGLFSKVFHVPDNYAAAYASSVFSVLCAGVIYTVVTIFFQDKLEIGEKMKSLIVLFVMAFGPLYFAGFNGTSYYRGQWSFNAWHNPTNSSVRFLALGCFYLFVYSIEMGQKQETMLFGRTIKKRQIDITLAILTLASLWFKPSFVQVFAPTVAVVLLIELLKNGIRKDSVQYILGYAIVFIPTGLLILWQAKAIFFSGDSSNSVEIAFLDVARHFSSNIPLSILASIAFPLFVILFCSPRLLENKSLVYAAIFYTIAYLEYALLAETGDRRYHGNFSWAYMLAIGVLFLSSIMQFIVYIHNGQETVGKGAKAFAGYLLLAGHLFWGIWYYWQLSPDMQFF